MLENKVNKQLVEAKPDFVYGKDIDEKTLVRRKTTLARVMQQAQIALKKAETAGDSELANKLQQKIEELQELMDSASNISGSNSNEDTEEDENTKNSEEDDSMNSNNQEAEDEEEPEDEDSDDDNDIDAKDDNDDDNENSLSDDSTESSQSNNNDVENNPKTNNDEDNNKTSSKASEEESEDENMSDSDDSEDGNNNSDDDSEEEINKASEDEDEGESDEGDSDEPNEDSNEDSEEGDSTDSDENSEEDSNDNESGGSDENDEDEEDSDEIAIKDDTILQDPFKNISDQLPPEIQKQVDKGDLRIETELEAIKRILSKLKGEARRGAQDAVKEIFKMAGYNLEESLTKNLNEAIKKSLSELSDDEFNKIVNDVLDLVDQNTEIDYSTDLEARIAEIKKDASNPLKNRELDQEDSNNLRGERQLARAREKENQKYQNFRTLDSFKINFYRAIKDQVEKTEDEDETWSVINRRTEDDPSIVKRGITIDDMNENIPTVDVYFDQSGSWGDKEIEIGKSAVSVINEFAERGEIKLNIYYFANHVHSDAASARAEGSTEAWPEIIQNIKAHKTKNVVIMTDSDVEWDAIRGVRHIVEGCVWYVWKNGRCAPTAPQKLYGRTGTFQYSFKTR